MLLAELISVGTELLMGEIVDSNAAYLAQELKNRGVFIQWKTIVGDNLDRIVEAIERAVLRSDIVILGGGLGPTDDDLTREGIAAVLHETPVIDEVYLEKLKAFFTARGRSYPESNNKQAWIIPSGEALKNPVGTAPGWFVRVPDTSKVIVAMPGPPREMKQMWAEQVLPRLNLPSSGFYHRTFRTFATACRPDPERQPQCCHVCTTRRRSCAGRRQRCNTRGSPRTRKTSRSQSASRARGTHLRL
jgi:nicotinamide-nucleotide amidase